MRKNKLKIGVAFLIVIILGFTAVSQLTGESSKKEVSEDVNVRQRNFKDLKTSSTKFRRNRGVSSPDLEVESAYSVYYSKEEGKEVLYSKNRLKRTPIASLTKLMTALVVHDNYNLNETLGIPESRFFTEDHLRDLKAFRDTTYSELLYLLLLESNNSGAYAAATSYSGIEFESFIHMMNKRAEKIGMKQTEYFNPSGLDNVEGVNYSTAVDQSKLIKELLDYPLFWEIMQKPVYRMESERSDLHYRIESTNLFLTGEYFRVNQPEPKWNDNLLGGKTGWTYQAGGCLIIVLEDEEGEGYYINIILGANSREERFEEMEKLINWIKNAYEPTGN